MGEQHVCEWKWQEEPETGYWFYCTDPTCDEAMSTEEAEHRLNEYETLKKATETLTAEMAQRAVNAKGFVGGLLSALRTYADILGRK